MQIGFLNPVSLPIIPAIKRLVDEFRSRNLPVLFTQFVNQINSPYENLIGWSDLRENSEIELHEAFRDLDDPIIQKNFYSAVTGEFLTLASREDWRTIVIVGVSTESCVLKTAVDCFEANFHPIVVTDACASDIAERMHDNGLAVIEVLIGKNQLMNTADLVDKLSADIQESTKLKLPRNEIHNKRTDEQSSS